MTCDTGQTTSATELLTQANWFAVQSKPRCEELAAGNLGNLDLDVFVPKIRQERLLFGKPSLLVAPLFRGYLFARFCPLVSLEAVRRAQGVLRVLGYGQNPIPVAAEIITEIRSRVEADGFIRLEPPEFRAGQRVTIEQGPFEGLMGQVEQEWDDGRRVSILLEAISKARVLIEKRWLASVPGL
ncbi:MAG: hypothetical protein L0Z50_30585 [Verrucomicrobiales bacterium]|nr:hypothetical protein [Verrucomicrobiales bacterium]